MTLSFYSSAPFLRRYAATPDEIVQLPRELRAVLVERRVAAEDSAAREVGFPVDAEPDFARNQVRVEEVRHDVALQDAVAVVGDDVFAHVEQTDV